MTTTILAASSFDHLMVREAEDGIFVVTLNRPERLNALHRALWDALDSLCAVVERDPSVRVVVLEADQGGPSGQRRRQLDRGGDRPGEP
jgi:enoyl-CoA hydratase/carnithine racemase